MTAVALGKIDGVASIEFKGSELDGVTGFPDGEIRAKEQGNGAPAPTSDEQQREDPSAVGKVQADTKYSFHDLQCGFFVGSDNKPYPKGPSEPSKPSETGNWARLGVGC